MKNLIKIRIFINIFIFLLSINTSQPAIVLKNMFKKVPWEIKQIVYSSSFSAK